MSDLFLAEAFLRRHPAHAARTLETIDPGRVAELLGSVPAAAAAAVLGVMSPASAADCLAEISPDAGAAAVAAMPPDLLAVLLRRMSPGRAEVLLGALPERSASVVRAGLAFPAWSVGAVMNPRAPTLIPDLEVAEAITRLRAAAAEVADVAYVVDRDQRLVGAVSARALLLSPAGLRVAELMRPPAARLPPQAAVGTLRAHPAWAHARTLPVVASDGRLLGAVGRDDLTRALPDPVAGRLGEASVGTLASFSELCFAGSTELVASLVSMLQQQTDRLLSGEKR